MTGQDMIYSMVITVGYHGYHCHNNPWSFNFLILELFFFFYTVKFQRAGGEDKECQCQCHDVSRLGAGDQRVGLGDGDGVLFGVGAGSVWGSLCEGRFRYIIINIAIITLIIISNSSSVTATLSYHHHCQYHHDQIHKFSSQDSLIHSQWVWILWNLEGSLSSCHWHWSLVFNLSSH